MGQGLAGTYQTLILGGGKPILVDAKIQVINSI